MPAHLMRHRIATIMFGCHVHSVLRPAVASYYCEHNFYWPDLQRKHGIWSSYPYKVIRRQYTSQGWVVISIAARHLNVDTYVLFRDRMYIVPIHSECFITAVMSHHSFILL